MPLELSNLRNNSKALRIDFGAAGDINLVYRPGNVTPNSIRRLQAVVAAEDAPADDDADAAIEHMDAIIAFVRDIVVRWDLQRNGAVIPLTDEGLGDVPMEVLMRILGDIGEDASLGETTGAASQPASHATSVKGASTSSRKRG